MFISHSNQISILFKSLKICSYDLEIRSIFVSFMYTQYQHIYESQYKGKLDECSESR